MAPTMHARSPTPATGAAAAAAPSRHLHKPQPAPALARRRPRATAAPLRAAAAGAAHDTAAATPPPPPPPPTDVAATADEVPRLDAALDDQLSRRPLSLDAAGYFILHVDSSAGELVADWYSNTINAQGLACDPVTGEVIGCAPGTGGARRPARSWRGRTAKALCVAVLEAAEHGGFQPCTRLEHAAYLGREAQRAEWALLTGLRYVQD